MKSTVPIVASISTNIFVAASGWETSIARTQQICGMALACCSSKWIRRAAMPNRNPRDASNFVSSSPIPDDAPMMMAEGCTNSAAAG
jgi:hypothetical protein